MKLKLKHHVTIINLFSSSHLTLSEYKNASKGSTVSARLPRQYHTVKYLTANNITLCRVLPGLIGACPDTQGSQDSETKKRDVKQLDRQKVKTVICSPAVNAVPLFTT